MDCVDEIEPGGALGLQDLFPLGRQPVIAPPPLASFFHPSSGNESTLFQPVEQRVEGGHVELQHSVRALFDQLADFIAVPRAVLDQGENEEFCAAFF